MHKLLLQFIKKRSKIRAYLEHDLLIQELFVSKIRSKKVIHLYSIVFFNKNKILSNPDKYVKSYLFSVKNPIFNRIQNIYNYKKI